jgi:hypothetical protein
VRLWGVLFHQPAQLRRLQKGQEEMNRRGFLKLLGLGAAGIALAPQLLEALPKEAAYEINPAWVNATYEIAYWVEGDVSPRALKSIVARRFNSVKEADRGGPGICPFIPVVWR